MKAFLIRSETRQRGRLLPLLFNIELDAPARGIWVGEEWGSCREKRAVCGMEERKVKFPPRRHLLTHLRADFLQSKQRWCPEGTRARRGAFSTQPEPRGRVARGAVVMETRTLPAPDCNSQRPPPLPAGKMVARRGKRGARDSEPGIPSPPGYSGEGPRVGAARSPREAARASAVARGPPRGWV